MLELWGGIECTVNRLGGRYVDQIALTGHDRRADDLARIARLGMRTLRYPVLWERVVRDGWSWCDDRLAELRRLKIRPIVGLLHHGSGPPDTDLLDAALPQGLAAHAAAVAARYPWVEDWTPVNEPLTTARFSGLYGLWYPHGRDDRSFVAMLLNQIGAIRAAMAAIRDIIPTARLLQTEDLGHTHATAPLAYQAAFENARRWLSLDLLTGRVGRRHPLRRWLTENGACSRLLDTWAAEPLPPDIIGINHYLSSERFLDHRLELYPHDQHGGNGRDRYVDTLAIRRREVETRGIDRLLAAAWARYRLPLAITESHNGSTREEQARWLFEVWGAAKRLQRRRVDIRAVTAWAVFGSLDWDSLVTQMRGHYESGLFDVRAHSPRPTLLATMAQQLAAGQEPDHPVLAAPGWWRRPDRFLDGIPSPPAPGRPILVIGASGTLGQAFARICAMRGLAVRALSRAECDAVDPKQVRTVLAALRPWAVINTAGYVRVDDAEREPDLARLANVTAASALAAATADADLPLLTFSSDLVFDGRQPRPYVEGDKVNPLSIYGATKVEAESSVLASCKRALVVRSSAFFGPWDDWNFVTTALRRLRGEGRFEASRDHIVTPTYVPDLVERSLDLLIDGATGVWHLANSTPISWVELARQAAYRAGVDPEHVVGRSGQELGWTANRPRQSSLASERGHSLPSLDDALDRYIHAVSAIERERLNAGVVA
jgi:dTDP-4-dehydrorhamnose reductase